MATKTPTPPRAWQRMLSGRRLDLLNPSPLDVEIEDIAHGLARVARWNGQTLGDHAYSVAQHSLLVTDILKTIEPTLKPKDALYALLHDAPEYVIGDMISPFKAAMGGDYHAVELRLEAAVHVRFGLAPHPSAALKKRIKKADKAAAHMEAITLAGFSAEEALQFFGALPKQLEANESWKQHLLPLPTFEAQLHYKQRFTEVLSHC